MKISLKTIKDVFKSLRDVDIKSIIGSNEDGKNSSIFDVIEGLDEKVINDVCVSITSKKKDYTEDLLGEGQALEIIGDFFLSILDKTKKSEIFKSLLERTLGVNLDSITKKMTEKTT